MLGLHSTYTQTTNIPKARVWVGALIHLPAVHRKNKTSGFLFIYSPPFFFFFTAIWWKTFSVISSGGGNAHQIQLRSNIGYRHNIADRDKWSMDNCAGLWLTASARPPQITALCLDGLKHSYQWPALFRQIQTPIASSWPKKHETRAKKPKIMKHLKMVIRSTSTRTTNPAQIPLF